MRMQLYEQGGRGHGGGDQELETRAEVVVRRQLDLARIFRWKWNIREFC